MLLSEPFEPPPEIRTATPTQDGAHEAALSGVRIQLARSSAGYLEVAFILHTGTKMRILPKER